MKTYEITIDELHDEPIVYHIVEDIQYYYNRDHILLWCYSTFGDSNSLHFGGRWEWSHRGTICFRNEQDRNWFILKWS